MKKKASPGALVLAGALIVVPAIAASATDAEETPDTIIRGDMNYTCSTFEFTPETPRDGFENSGEWTLDAYFDTVDGETVKTQNFVGNFEFGETLYVELENPADEILFWSYDFQANNGEGEVIRLVGEPALDCRSDDSNGSDEDGEDEAGDEEPSDDDDKTEEPSDDDANDDKSDETDDSADKSADTSKPAQNDETEGNESVKKEPKTLSDDAEAASPVQEQPRMTG